MKAGAIVLDFVGLGYLLQLLKRPAAWAVITLVAAGLWWKHQRTESAKVVHQREPVEFKALVLPTPPAGADAAARYAEMLASATPARPIKGTVLYCATGGATLAVTSKVPQFFALAANDEVLGTAGMTTARDNAQYLAGRGIASAITSTTPAPVYNGRFNSLALTAPSFSAADATAVWNAVKTAGFLDDNNYVKDPPSLEAVRTALPTAY